MHGFREIFFARANRMHIVQLVEIIEKLLCYLDPKAGEITKDDLKSLAIFLKST
jgi:hypothetical protein